MRPASRPHASVRAFGTLAYKNSGRGPNVSYARSIGTGPDGGPPGLIPIAQSIPTISAISLKPKHLAENAGIAVMLLLLVALPAELFNSTLQAHNDRITRSKGLIRKFASNLEEKLNRLGNLSVMIILSAIGAILSCLVDPTFGFNRSSLAEVMGYFGTILITIGVTQLARSWYVERRFSKPSKLKTYPIGIMIALVLVIFSRIAHFEPGYVFGIFAALAFRVEPTQREEGKSVAMASIWLMLVALATWLIWIPLKHHVDSGHTSFFLLVADSMFATIWICALQSLLFGLVPIKYLDGECVVKWSKKAWLAIYGVVIFVFVETVMHPTSTGYGANSHANLLSMLYLFFGFTIVAVVFWSYFRVRYGKESENEDSSEPATSDTFSSPISWPPPSGSLVPGTQRSQEGYSAPIEPLLDPYRQN